MVLHDTYGADLSQTCLADVLAMLVSLTLGEIFFTLVHKFILHRTTFGAKIHACHHCARFSNVFVGQVSQTASVAIYMHPRAGRRGYDQDKT